MVFLLGPTSRMVRGLILSTPYSPTGGSALVGIVTSTPSLNNYVLILPLGTSIVCHLRWGAALFIRLPWT